MLPGESRETTNRILGGAIVHQDEADGAAQPTVPGRDCRCGDSPPSLGTGQRLHVLLVTHSDRDAAQVLRALRAGGFEVRHERVTDADALRSAIASQRGNIVVAEFRMPGWGDRQVLQIVQTVAPDLPVILICGAVGEDAAVMAVKLGASDCISKAQLQNRLAPSVQSVFDRLHERAEV